MTLCEHGHEYAECGGCGWAQIEARFDAHLRAAFERQERNERVLAQLHRSREEYGRGGWRGSRRGVMR